MLLVINLLALNLFLNVGILGMLLVINLLALNLFLNVGLVANVRASHAIARAQVAPNEAAELAAILEPKHGRDLFESLSIRFWHAEKGEGNHSSAQQTKEEQGSCRPHGAGNHKRSHEGTEHVGGTPIDASAKTDCFSSDTQRHDLRDVQPRTKAPRHAEEEHKAHDCCDDDPTCKVNARMVAAKVSNCATDQHTYGHACHAPDQQRPPTEAVGQAEAANGVPNEKEDSRRKGGC